MAEKIYNADQFGDKYMRVGETVKSRFVDGQDAVTIGGGNASDTALVGIWVFAAFTGNLSVTGFYKKDTADVAKTLTLTMPGPAFYQFGGMLNEAGALTVTAASVTDDEKALVIYRDV